MICGSCWIDRCAISSLEGEESSHHDVLHQSNNHRQSDEYKLASLLSWLGTDERIYVYICWFHIDVHDRNTWALFHVHYTICKSLTFRLNAGTKLFLCLTTVGQVVDYCHATLVKQIMSVAPTTKYCFTYYCDFENVSLRISIIFVVAAVPCHTDAHWFFGETYFDLSLFRLLLRPNHFLIFSRSLLFHCLLWVTQFSCFYKT